MEVAISNETRVVRRDRAPDRSGDRAMFDRLEIREGLHWRAARRHARAELAIVGPTVT